MAISSSGTRHVGGDDGGATRANPTPDDLLEKAQQFSMFAVQHVEEVRHALVSTADTSSLNKNGADTSANDFGSKNGDEITAAFEELTATYDKLSSLKWDAARMEFEELHRSQLGLESNASSGGTEDTRKTNNTYHEHGRLPLYHAKGEKRVTVMTASGDDAGGVKDDPWQNNEDGGDMNPHHWIADAFLKGEISSAEEDEGGDSFPINGRLSSLTGTADSNYPATTSPTAKMSPTPPGFKSESSGQKHASNEAEVEQAARLRSSSDGSARHRSHTSMCSEVSSLHTTSHPHDAYSDDSDDGEDSDYSDYSDTSSSSEELPSMENFDYLYKGGYAMQVSGGKETKGVVPKTVKRVLVGSSVKTIEEGAFQGCNNLESVTVSSSVETVGDHAFRKCSKLKHVTFLTKAPKRRRHQPRNSEKLDEKKEEKNSWHRRSASAPSSTTEPRSSSLRSIGEWAFFNCSSLLAVKLPYGLENIGTRAFQRCSSMSISELPKTLISVGENAFVGCPRETKAAFERWEKEHST